MPTCNVYFSDEEYSKLAYLAANRKQRIPLVIRALIKDALEQVEKNKAKA